METPHFINVYKLVISTVESVYRIIFPWISYLPTWQNRKFHKALKEFDEFIFDIIETKRNEIHNKKDSVNGRVDLLTSILKSSEQEGIHIDAKTLRDQIMTYFIAGHDSEFESILI